MPNARQYTAVVSFGRNRTDGTPLSLAEWSAFRHDVARTLSRYGWTIVARHTGPGTYGTITEHSATCVGVRPSIHANATGAERRHALLRIPLAQLAARYAQDTIALTVSATTELIPADEYAAERQIAALRIPTADPRYDDAPAPRSDSEILNTYYDNGGHRP
jgi:hypothetical protein